MVTMTSNLMAMASTLMAMASILTAMAFNQVAMAPGARLKKNVFTNLYNDVLVGQRDNFPPRVQVPHHVSEKTTFLDALDWRCITCGKAPHSLARVEEDLFYLLQSTSAVSHGEHTWREGSKTTVGV